ncbi:MAG: hypothetical protein ACT4OU_09980 [Hyphomicrobium sp.]
MTKHSFQLAALALSFVISAPPAAGAEDESSCKVVAGTVADLAAAPNMPGGHTVTLDSTHKAEFRWNPMDKESIGWMRITDAKGAELGWVPAGHEAVRCGKEH